MNILIITNDLYPNLNANSTIAYTVAESLANKGCDVTVLGFRHSDVKTNSSFKFDEVSIQSISKYFRIATQYKNNRKKRAMYFLFDNDFRRISIGTHRGQDAYVREYKTAIENILKTRQIDCIIAFAQPTDTLKALNLLKNTPPIISYKLDPWSTNYYERDKEKAAKEEALADEKASAIVVTKQIYHEYQKQNNPYIDKLIVANFPCVIKPENQDLSDNPFDKNEINCVFAGHLYHDIRNPEYTLKLFKQLQNHHIKLHIFGGQVGDCLEHLPENVTYYGQITPTELKRYMDHADILVNIGNTITNQVPSKTYSYISYGKPIINFVKSQNCPTLDCLANYPLALNVFETSELDEELIQKVSDFCIHNKGNVLEWDMVKDLYHDCTPDYIVENLYNLISDIIGSK